MWDASGLAETDGWEMIEAGAERQDVARPGWRGFPVGAGAPCSRPTVGPAGHSRLIPVAGQVAVKQMPCRWAGRNGTAPPVSTLLLITNYVARRSCSASARAISPSGFGRSSVVIQTRTRLIASARERTWPGRLICSSATARPNSRSRSARR